MSRSFGAASAWLHLSTSRSGPGPETPKEGVGVRVASFKVKLVVYFLLLALVPLGAAFWGFSAVVRRSETRRVDARLQAGLRSAVAAYQDEVLAAGRPANRLARDPPLQRALLQRDRRALAPLLRGEPHVTVALGREAPARSALTVQRTASVLNGARVLGEVVAQVPVD